MMMKKVPEQQLCNQPGMQPAQAGAERQRTLPDTSLKKEAKHKTDLLSHLSVVL